ncbi:hypothetical protein ABT030_46965 [Streptomyces mirabilis]|uniref:hypothetical protein n=1 Tax=Streptomyces mirabilis TaxID=68239 RepID=UPI00331A3654
MHASTVEDVVEEATVLRDRIMVLFERLSAQVLETASAGLHRDVASLGHWIRANPEWGMSCERCRDPDDSSWRRRRWADAPTPYSEVPIPVSAIAWWWEQLRK